MKKITVLIVEDEIAIRDLVRFSMPSTEFDLLEAGSAKQAEQLLLSAHPDIILLDWMLPGKSGLDFLKFLRASDSYRLIPVIMLTAKAEEENKLKGLDSGADDYIIKPFSPLELIARIKTVLRRGLIASSQDEIKVNALLLNKNTHKVSIENRLLNLTPIEFRLLYFFITHPNRTYSRSQLIHYVWNDETDIYDRTVDVQIRRLRDRLKPFNYHLLIKTIRGVGYLFESS